MNHPHVRLNLSSCAPHLATQLQAVNQSITAAVADPDKNRDYLLAVAADLVREEVLYHESIDVRRQAANCLSGILLRPQVARKNICLRCRKEFSSFSEQVKHHRTCNGTAPAAPAALADDSEEVLALVKLGFSREAARAALQQHNGDPNRAADWLFQQASPAAAKPAPAAALASAAAAPVPVAAGGVPPPTFSSAFVTKAELAANMAKAAAKAAAPAAAPAAASKSNSLRTSGRVALRSSGQRPSCLSIHYAAREGNEEAIKWFVEHGTAVDQIDEHSNTALYYAILCGRHSAVELLFNLGAFLDMHDPEGERYMMATNYQAIRDLIRSRAVNGKVKRTDEVYVWKPALDGNAKAVANVLKVKNLRLNAKHKSGYSALDFAVLKGHKDVTRELKAAGAWNTLISDMQQLLESADFADAEFVIESGGGLPLGVHMPIMECRVDVKDLMAYLHAAIESSLAQSPSVPPAAAVAPASPPAAARARIIVKRRIRRIDLMAILAWIYSGNMFLPEKDCLAAMTEFADAMRLPVLSMQVSRLARAGKDLGSISECNIGQSYGRLYLDKRAMDLEFQSTNGSGREWFAHKAIVSGRSAYFHTMLHSAMKEGRTNLIQLDPDISDEAFDLLLLFIYTDSVGDVSKITGDIALELISLSSQWMLPPLRALAEAIVLTEFAIEWDDAIELWKYAKLHGALEFAAECQHVLHYNAPLGETAQSHPHFAALAADERAALTVKPKPKKNQPVAKK